MWRSLVSGAAGAAAGVGAAVFGDVDPLLFGSAGAIVALPFPMVSRSTTVAAAGVVSFGLAQATAATWPVAAVLFLVLFAVGEFSRSADRPSSPEAARWSPAIFWCAAVGLFFVAIWGPSVTDARPASAAILALGIAPAMIASRVSNIGPVVFMALLSGVGALLAPLASVRVGHAVGATLPLMVWSLPHLLAVRATRLREVGLVGSISGVVAGDLATCLGAGYTPRGSGTVGAVTALPFAWWLSSFDLAPRLVAALIVTAISIPVAYRYCAGSTEDLDPSEVVLDEFIGVLIPLVIVPWTWGWVITAFVLFRFFDIAKPGPIRWMDKNIKNPAGIMLDDVAAGIFAAVVILVVRPILG